MLHASLFSRADMCRPAARRGQCISIRITTCCSHVHLWKRRCGRRGIGAAAYAYRGTVDGTTRTASCFGPMPALPYRPSSPALQIVLSQLGPSATFRSSVGPAELCQRHLYQWTCRLLRARETCHHSEGCKGPGGHMRARPEQIASHIIENRHWPAAITRGVKFSP